MALLGKKKKKEDKEQEASISQDGDGEALENSGDVTDNNVSAGGEANAEQALLNQYTEGLASIPQSHDDESEESTDENTAEAPSEEPAEDDVDDSLMDIFASEEEEDADLSALTFGLEDIDVQSLLAEAKNVADRLRALVESQQKSA